MAFKRSTLRYGETPEPVTPYQKAAQVWDERIGSARVQAHNWRLMALGSLALSLVLAAILLWLGRSGTAVPYVVEIDPKGGARAVGPATEIYRPSDAQIAFHLARFIENVRSLSIDPVVVRQSWLKAIVLWFPPERVALANGWYIMLGALGALSATGPADAVVQVLGWRGLFAALAAASAAVALTILLVVPESKSQTQTAASPRIGFLAIYLD